jgi:hypothetical protein
MTKYKPFYYEQTKYPKIYSRFYWGSFSDDLNEIIKDNRNKFVLEYDIKNSCKPPQYVEIETHLKGKDHCEYYLNNNKQYVIIMSPYENKDRESFIDKGWNEIYPLYSINAITFIKIIDMKRK